MRRGIIIKNGHKEQGFVSIFSVIIIMSILTLVLVGFSNITRQAQRRTLDDQLNTQAFYAAESGINDAKAVLAAVPAGTSYNKAVCQGADPGFNYTFETNLNVGYSCVLINSEPSDVRFSSVPLEGAEVAKTITLASKSGNAFDQFSVLWDSPTQGDALPSDSTPSLTPRDTWGTKVGMLRLDVVPIVDGALDRAALVANSYIMFLYPTYAGGVVSKSYSPGPAAQGSVDLVKCDSSPTPTDLRCKLDVTLTGTGISKRYMVRLQSIYNLVQAAIGDVKEQTTNAKVQLKDGQAVVDVTGRANDVFRRVQVRLPLKQTGFASSTVLQSADSVCKLLAVGPTTTVETGVIPAGTPAQASASCIID